MPSAAEWKERALEITNRYLDGRESFEVAARKLADMLREERAQRPAVGALIRSPDGRNLVQTPGLSMFIRSQTPEMRANSPLPEREPTAQERDEDERAQHLWDEARRLDVETSNDAA